MRVLFVCTGNLCRSPMAERLATSWAGTALGLETARPHISSAGIAARVGEAMDARSAAALRRLGGVPDEFRARALTAEMVEQADLVLTMTRRQRGAVLELSPRGLRRTFTLLEAADLVGALDMTGLKALSPDARAREVAQRLDAGRAHRRVSEDDDVFDPIGRRQAVHDEVAEVIAQALRPLSAVLFRGETLDTLQTSEGGFAARP